MGTANVSFLIVGCTGLGGWSSALVYAATGSMVSTSTVIYYLDPAPSSRYLTRWSKEPHYHSL